MLRNEAAWLGRQLEVVDVTDLSPLLNVGSSNGVFRSEVQPWIDDSIFQPLRMRGVRVHHLDIDAGIDVDISGDITDPDFRGGLRDIGARSILCSNLLEHVHGPERVCAALEELLPPGGLLFLSVPHEFPYHPDPIDTMFRPDVEHLLRLFPGSECVRAESIAGGRSWDLAAGGLMTVARKGVQRLVTQTRVQTSAGGGIAAQGALTYIPWLFRPFRVTCAVLRKTS
jgi:SAM-dependent methyltransferase